MRLSLLVLALIGFIGLQLHAQELGAFADLQRSWEAAATRAQDIIENGEETPGQLLDMRRLLDQDRQEITNFIAAAEARLAPLLDQRDALGAAPDSGSEPAEVARLRADLTEKIDAENGPLLAARQLRERITAEITAIDSLQRKKFSEQLLTRTDFPWTGDALFQFIDDNDTIARNAWKQLLSEWQGLRAAGVLASVLPSSIAIFVIGLGLVLLGPPAFARRYEARSTEVFGGYLTPKILSAINVFAIVLGGFWLMLFAAERLGLFSERGLVLLSAMKLWLVLGVVGYWIGRRSEKPDSASGHVLIVVLSAVLLGFDLTQGALVSAFNLGPLTATVGHFLAVLGFFPLTLFLTRRDNFYGYFEVPENALVLRLIEAARLVVRYANYLILLLAIVGYYALSRQLLIALSVTIGLGWFGYWLFETITEFGFNLIDRLRGEPLDEASHDVGDDEEERSALWPVLVAVMVGGATLPIILIAWGFDKNLLLEFWVKLIQGFTIGGIRLSLGAISGFLIIFAVGYFVIRGLQALLGGFILPRTRMDIGARSALVSLFGYVGYTVVTLFAISAAGIDLGNLAVVFGALSVGIGFGLQNIVSNFVSGIILLIERPIKKGDWISVSGNEGFVRDIKVRATEIETFDRATIIVPNSDLISQPVLNWVYANKSARVRIPIGVGYDSDANKVREVLLEIAAGSKWALRIPAPQVIFESFGDSALNFELRFHIRDADYSVPAKSDINFAIFARFREEGIEIPFPIRDVRITQL